MYDRCHKCIHLKEDNKCYMQGCCGWYYYEKKPDIPEEKPYFNRNILLNLSSNLLKNLEREA